MVLLKKYIYLILLLGILIFSFKARYINPISLADLEPLDASVYALSAYNLYQHHIYGFKFWGQYYPSQYPFGFPLLIIPFYIFFGNQPYNAIYCSLFFSLLSLVFAYLIGKELGNRFTGLIAALFVALCPKHIEYSKYIMTEASSTFFTLFICWLVLKVIYFDSKKQGLLLLFLGIIAGFSVLVHLSNCLLIPPILISLLLVRKSNIWSWSMVKKQTLIIFGIILALTPLLLYQSHAFGSPLRTGFAMREPELFGKFKCFSFKFFAHPPPHPHNAWKKGNFIVYSSALAGLNKDFYPVSMIPLILGGSLLIFSKRRKQNKQMKFLIFSSIVVASLFIFFLFYHWQDSRLLLRGVPLLMILAAYCTSYFVDKGIFKSLTKGSVFSITILSLLLITIVQMAFWSYSQPKSLRWVSDLQYRIIQYITKHTPHNAVIISDFNMPLIPEYYFTEHTASKRVYISVSIPEYKRWVISGKIKPIKYDSTRKYSFLFFPDGTPNSETYNFIGQALRKRVPVYFFYNRRRALCIKFLPFIKEYFRMSEQNGGSGLFRLYPKDW
ncbi:MAG: glycosyltransferase family 39 protein [Candidatus Aminicenantes bacterium]|nr:glycosyltransferase family 39 protein [Candidatus Aminicenantes bacterium]